jgi:hypothetical protein
MKSAAFASTIGRKPKLRHEPPPRYPVTLRKSPVALEAHRAYRKYWSSLHETLADGRKRSGLSAQQATQQRLFLAVGEFGHCAPGLILVRRHRRAQTIAPLRSSRGGGFLRFSGKALASDRAAGDNPAGREAGVSLIGLARAEVLSCPRQSDGTAAGALQVRARPG